MNKVEYLLECLAEECAEVIHRKTKLARFGPDEKQSGQDLTNLDRLRAEVCDLFAVLELLDAAMEPRLFWEDEQMEAAIKAKREKLEKYMDYSRKLGTLT